MGSGVVGTAAEGFARQEEWEGVQLEGASGAE